MKKILLLLTIILTISSCQDNRNQDGTWNVEYSNNPGVATNPTIVVIDNCEYIKWGYGLTHKGNCKYCEERRKQEKEN